jgi:hypothetical protein
VPLETVETVLRLYQEETSISTCATFTRSCRVSTDPAKLHLGQASIAGSWVGEAAAEARQTPEAASAAPVAGDVVMLVRQTRLKEPELFTCVSGFPPNHITPLLTSCCAQMLRPQPSLSLDEPQTQPLKIRGESLSNGSVCVVAVICGLVI